MQTESIMGPADYEKSVGIDAIQKRRDFQISPPVKSVAPTREMSYIKKSSPQPDQYELIPVARTIEKMPKQVPIGRLSQALAEPANSKDQSHMQQDALRKREQRIQPGPGYYDPDHQKSDLVNHHGIVKKDAPAFNSAIPRFRDYENHRRSRTIQVDNEPKKPIYEL